MRQKSMVWHHHLFRDYQHCPRCSDEGRWGRAPRSAPLSDTAFNWAHTLLTRPLSFFNDEILTVINDIPTLTFIRGERHPTLTPKSQISFVSVLWQLPRRCAEFILVLKIVHGRDSYEAASWLKLDLRSGSYLHTVVQDLTQLWPLCTLFIERLVAKTPAPAVTLRSHISRSRNPATNCSDWWMKTLSSVRSWVFTFSVQLTDSLYVLGIKVRQCHLLGTFPATRHLKAPYTFKRKSLECHFKTTAIINDLILKALRWNWNCLPI